MQSSAIVDIRIFELKLNNVALRTPIYLGRYFHLVALELYGLPSEELLIDLDLGYLLSLEV